MRWSVTIGRIAGTAVRIHVTFLLFLIWIGWANWADGGREAAIGAVSFILALFLCVLAHEFGHIAAARRFGIRTPTVTLLPIGGVALLERIPTSPAEELIVAIAGPMVNVAIAAGLFLALGLSADDISLGALEDFETPMLARLAAANIVLVLFNLVPAFPMDGGRVLRALLSLRFDRVKATLIAVRIGQAIAFGFMLLGFMGQPMLFFIALFVWIAGAQELNVERRAARLAATRIGEAMERGLATLHARASVLEAIPAIAAGAQPLFPVLDENGAPVGLLARAQLEGAARLGGVGLRLADIVREPVLSRPAQAGLDAAIAAFSSNGADAILVTDASGRYCGLLTRARLAALLGEFRTQGLWPRLRQWLASRRGAARSR